MRSYKTSYQVLEKKASTLKISGNMRNIQVYFLFFINSHTKGFDEDDDTIVALYEVLEEMSDKERSLFLLFVTGCSRPPTLVNIIYLFLVIFC